MSKHIKIRKLSSQEELDKRIRRVWTLQPCTKVIPSRKLYSRKEKHKGNDEDSF